MKNKYIIITILILILILISSLGYYVYKWENRKPVFEVHFFSLNRGRAIFIRTPENMTILVGGGQNSDTIRELTKVMPFYRKKIDYIFIPSAIPAQIGGLIEIVDRYGVGEVVLSKIHATSTVLSKLLNNISNKKIHIREVEKGDELDMGGLKVEVLFPYEDFKFNKTSLPELALGIGYKDTTVFLLGNISKTIQKNIAKSLIVNSKENIVEYYNSGIESKVSKDLVEKIKPRYMFTTKEKPTSWISDGLEWKKI